MWAGGAASLNVGWARTAMPRFAPSRRFRAKLARRSEWSTELSIREHWSGDAWEDYSKQLLIIRYGVAFQPVFDRDRGDWGIEGYVSDDAAVFQCYAADDPRDASDLYDKQRNKVTVDLKKLVANRGAIVGAMGCPVKLWVLLVPDCDSKRILEHTGRKQADLRARSYPEIAGDFVIRVLTHREFESEKAQLSASVLLLPDSTGEVVSTPMLAELSAKADLLAPAASDQLVERFVQHFLRGQDLLQSIKSNYPEVWAGLDKAIRARERGLETASLVDDGAFPPLPTLVEELEARVASAAPGLGNGQAQDIAWGTLADWLIRCPLDPRPI
jgi:hypothetical protein